MSACLNCGAEPAGRFCQACGQRAAAARLHPNELARDFAGNVLNFDVAIWRTFLGLLRNPARVAKEYVAGRRRSFVNPLKYFVFALAAYFLAMAGVDLQMSELANLRIQVDEERETLQEAGRAVLEFLDSQHRTMMMIGVPVYAWVLGLLFRSRRYNFAENCVLVLFAFAQGTVLFRIPALLVSAATGRPLLLAGVALQAFYLAWAVRGFYGTNWLAAFTASVLSLATWMLSLTAIVAGCVAVAFSLS